MVTESKYLLDDPEVFPDEGALKEVLGPACLALTELLDGFVKLGLSPEWRYYKDGGWLCRTTHKKKTTLWYG